MGPAGQRAPAGAAHARPVRQPRRRGRLPAAVPRAHAGRRRARPARRAVGERSRRCARGARGQGDGVGCRRRRSPVPDLDDLRGGAGAAHDSRPRRAVRAAADVDHLRPRPAAAADQAGPDRRHVDDREAGRLGRAGEHDHGRPGRRRQLPADRAQVVHVRTDVGPVPDPRPGARRACPASSSRACCPTARRTRSACSGSRTSSATGPTPRRRSSTRTPSAGWSATRAAACARSSRWST